MTVTTTTNIAIATGNGIATIFPYSFPIPAASNLFVRLLDATTNQIIQTLNPGDFSVTGLGTPAGGAVTYPLVGAPLDSTKKIMIQRIMPYTQDLDIQNEGGFYPEVVEQQLDDIVMQIQQIAEVQGRSVVSPPGIPGQTFPSPEDNTIIGWQGTVLVNIDPATFLSIVLPPNFTLEALEALLPFLPTTPPVGTWKLWNNGGTLSFTTP